MTDRTVWVADDRPAVAQSIAAMLQAEGMDAVALHGAGAVRQRLAGGDEPRLLILDMGMPGNGGGVLGEIAMEPRWTFPVVVLTGNEDALTETLAPRVWDGRALPKTTPPVELIAVVRRALGVPGGT